MNKFIYGLLLGIFLIILVEILIGYHLEVTGKSIAVDKFLLHVTFSGAMGGLLFSIQNKTLKLPSKEDDSTFELAFLSDIFAGIAGAYLIFLILPFDINTSKVGSLDSMENLKIIATGILGGYGGRSVLRLAYQKLALDIFKYELEKQKKDDSKALRLLDTQLSNSRQEVPGENLEEAIKSASETTQEIIFYKTSGIQKE